MCPPCTLMMSGVEICIAESSMFWLNSYIPFTRSHAKFQLNSLRSIQMATNLRKRSRKILCEKWPRARLHKKVRFTNMALNWTPLYIHDHKNPM